MQLTITAKNFELTPAIKQHADEKFDSLGQHFTNLTHLHIVLHIEHIDHCAEVTLHSHGVELHATAKAEDMYGAIDQLCHKIYAQLQKQKEKTIDTHR